MSSQQQPGPNPPTEGVKRNLTGMRERGILATPRREVLDSLRLAQLGDPVALSAAQFPIKAKADPVAALTNTSVAIGLSEQQVKTILASEHPNNPQAQEQALASLRQGNTVEIMDNRADLDYEPKLGNFYATVDQADRVSIVEHFRGLEANAKAQSQQPSPVREDFEHE